MFKNLKFGVKIGAGFAVLLILLGVVAAVGYLGLRQVQAKVAGMTAAKDITIHILEARREEKNYIIRGGQDYVDKVAVAVKALNASIASLSSGGLNAAQKASIAVIEKGSKDYEASFASYVGTQISVVDTQNRWKATGDQLTAALDRADPSVTIGFLRLRLAGVYFLKDKTDDRWKVLQSNLDAFTPIFGRWISSARKGADTETLSAAYRDYQKMAGDCSALFKKLSDMDAAMVAAGRAVIDNATTVEGALDGECRQTISSVVLLILISTVSAVLLGILMAVTLTLGITRPVRKAVVFAGSLASCDFSGLLDIHQKDEWACSPTA